MKNKKVGVVIVTFNGMKWIEACLASLINSTIPLSIIVVDNNSTDDTVSFVKNNFKDIILLEQTQNIGFGKANNLGIKKAYEEGADYVFLLNQDAWVEPDTISNLVKAQKNQPEYGIVSPMHLNGKGDALDYNFSNYINPSKCKNLYSDIFLNKTLEGIYETDFVNAAAWLLSRNCIEMVGGFNPSFFHYGEDLNYVERLKYHGLKTGVLPTSIIYHDREYRKPNKFFSDLNIIYNRSLILEYSNPFEIKTFNKEYLKCIKKIFKALFLFNFNQLKQSFFKIKILNNLDKKQIIRNRAESRRTKNSFIN
ncbi:glycosyltransferase family 2 protein [Flavobacterium foetidum]|uniref:glycosyltransferase family 2 protein n=1 Tax=Flavobacterium foetidum TaxID=2026681 RepID=UPI0010750657|nr:glycosyltransferase family 2 protein [Flavobacterium foetidum]KAF2513553.1 glycosyltransferase family 2 protein [Flavobacterium foetidum]